MNQMTAQDLSGALLASGTLQEGEIVARMEALTTMVLDLLAEVEALRQAQATNSDYRRTYRAASLLTHDNSSVLTGLEKLIARYYPGQRCPDHRVWRELIMLRRLGFSAEEIEVYQRRPKKQNSIRDANVGYMPSCQQRHSVLSVTSTRHGGFRTRPEYR